MSEIHQELRYASQELWDAIVIGAGPAGAVTALGLSRRGQRVLLLDRSRFPRSKVCGGCLNRQAVQDLEELGLTSQLSSLNGNDVEELILVANSGRVNLKLPPGLAVSRKELDSMLLREAISSGVHFIPNVIADLKNLPASEHARTVTCRQNHKTISFDGRIVIVASGLLSQASHSESEFQVKTWSRSRIGAGCIASDYPSEYEPGTIYMAVGRNGYVGLTRVENNQLNIAAALDIASTRIQSPSQVCQSILQSSGLSYSESMLSGPWHGTQALTRKPVCPAFYRIFCVGDAAGYIEPFTGSGMAWAIRGACALLPIAIQGVQQWDSSLVEKWKMVLRQQIASQQRSCNTLIRILRQPLLVRTSIALMNSFPSLGQAIVQRLNYGSRYEFSDLGRGHIRSP